MCAKHKKTSETLLNKAILNWGCSLASGAGRKSISAELKFNPLHRMTGTFYVCIKLRGKSHRFAALAFGVFFVCPPSCSSCDRWSAHQTTDKPSKFLSLGAFRRANKRRSREINTRTQIGVRRRIIQNVENGFWHCESAHRLRHSITFTIHVSEA